MEFLKDLWEFMKVRKKYWLTPIILTLLMIAVLAIFGQGQTVAPFIYTIF